MRTTPTSGAQTGCHGNIGCLATGPRNLQFMTVYFKNKKPLNLKMGRHVQHYIRVLWPNFGKNRSKAKVTRTDIVHS